MSKRISFLALTAAIAIATAGPALAAPGADSRPPAPNATAAEVAAHWTADRQAAAIPRDLTIDASGKAYINSGKDTVRPYGTGQAPQPAAKPGGAGGGGSTSTTVANKRWTDPNSAVIKAAGRIYFDMTDDAGACRIRVLRHRA